jgi:hypothetical protein
VARLEPIDDNDLLWAELLLPDAEPVRSPVFPFRQVSGADGFGALTPSVVASVMDLETRSGTGELTVLTAIPTLEVLSQTVTVRTTQPVPSQALGADAVSVVDYLRVATEPSRGVTADHLVVIDHTARSVLLLGSPDGGLPAPVDGPTEAWLRAGLDDDEIATSEVVIDRAGLLGALGLEGDAPVALGVARTVMLDDGRYLSSEGAMATLEWFDEATAQVVPPAEQPPATAPGPAIADDAEVAGDDGPDLVVLAVAAGVAFLLLGAAFIASRRNRRAFADPDSALGAMAKVVDAATHDTDEEGPAVDDLPGAEDRVGEPGGPRRPVPAKRPGPPTSPGPPRSPGPPGVRVPRTPAPAGDPAEAVAPGTVAPSPQPELPASDATGAPAGAGAGSAAGASDAAGASAAARVGRDALYAAMRRRASQSGPTDDAPSPAAGGGSAPGPSRRPDPGVERTDPEAGELAGSGPDEGAEASQAPTGTSGSADRPTKGTRPDDALEALLWEIENLPMPGDRSSTD